MKQYTICALLFFGTLIQAEEKNDFFNIQSDISLDSYDLDDQKITQDELVRFQKEEDAANNDPEHAATWQAMRKDLNKKQALRSLLENESYELTQSSNQCAKNPERMANADKDLVVRLQKLDAQQCVVFFAGIPSSLLTGIALAFVKPTSITNNKAAQAIALREFLPSWFGLTQKVTYKSDTLNIQASVHTADAITGLALYALDAYRLPKERTTGYAISSVASALVKYSLKTVQTKTLIGNNNVLILSNQNVLSAITNSAAETIRQLPKRSSPSASELAYTLGINVALEINYNITAQVLRKITPSILDTLNKIAPLMKLLSEAHEAIIDTYIPENNIIALILRKTTTPILSKIPRLMELTSENSEAIINACIPENYEPNNYLQHIVKYGINCGTCLAAYSTYKTIASALMELSIRCNPI